MAELLKCGCTGINCPMHKASPDMYEALKDIYERREHPCLGKVCRLYEGEPNARCQTEGFIAGCSYGLKERMKKIESALAKAEGK